MFSQSNGLIFFLLLYHKLLSFDYFFSSDSSERIIESTLQELCNMINNYSTTSSSRFKNILWKILPSQAYTYYKIKSENFSFLPNLLKLRGRKMVVKIKPKMSNTIMPSLPVTVSLSIHIKKTLPLKFSITTVTINI